MLGVGLLGFGVLFPYYYFFFSSRSGGGGRRGAKGRREERGGEIKTNKQTNKQK